MDDGHNWCWTICQKLKCLWQKCSFEIFCDMKTSFSKRTICFFNLLMSAQKMTTVHPSICFFCVYMRETVCKNIVISDVTRGPSPCQRQHYSRPGIRYAYSEAVHWFCSSFFVFFIIINRGVSDETWRSKWL